MSGMMGRNRLLPINLAPSWIHFSASRETFTALPVHKLHDKRGGGGGGGKRA